MSPMEPLVAGGAAEAFGQHLLVVDLSGVPAIDSAGIRALVRGYTTGQRVGGTWRLAAAPPAVSCVLELAHLAGDRPAYPGPDLLHGGAPVSPSDDVTVKYHTWLDPRTSLEDLSVQLMKEGAGVKSVAWEHQKRERA